MFYFHIVTLIILFGFSLTAELSVENIHYETTTDELQVRVSFPGKCLPHDVLLKPSKQKGNRYYFLLSVTNAEQDPCNAKNSASANFSMKDVVLRPAEILVSPKADGSEPYVITIPVHKTADIVHVDRAANEAALLVNLRFRGQLEKNRFYIDLNEKCSGTYSPICDAVIRDRLSFQKGPVKTEMVKLAFNHLTRPITLSFSTTKDRILRVHLP